MPRNRRHRLAPESGVSAARPGRAEQARALSIFFFGGSAIGLVAVAFLPLTPHTDVRTATVAVAIAAALGTLLYVRAERMPGWALQVALAAGTAIVSWGSVYVAGHGQNSNELFYVWVVLYAFYFLRPRAAALQLAFVGVAYAVALGLRHEQFAVTNWVLTMSTLTVAGVVVARLVARIDRWAAHSDEREQALRHAEELFRRAFDDAAIGMALVDLDGRWIRVNGALSRLTGYAERDLIGKGFRDLTPPEDLARDVRVLEELVSGRQSTHYVEKRYRHADGQIVWVALSASVVRGADGSPMYLISQMQDITERKAAEQELTDRALHDPLTGLPNRVLFVDRLEVALRRIDRDSAPVAVLFLDLDRFKLVNDSFGHAAGDRVLVDVGDRLRALLRPSDTIARFGGDELTILCENTDERGAGSVAQRIARSLSDPFLVDGHEVFVSSSIGVSIGRDAEAPADALLREADAAMYRAKQQGRSRFAIFDGGMRLRGAERLELENELRRALDRDELCLRWQPEVCLATGRVEGVEALVRWQHPERGMIPPGEFIAVAEESGLIVPLGEWVLHEACQQARTWEAAASSPLTVAINLSPRQLAEPELCDAVQRALDASGIAPGSVCLEITESAAVDAGLPTLRALKDLGVQLALDDFGIGFSSLSQIRRMPPVDVLKIDQSFVAEIGLDGTETAIVAAIIGMARTLKMTTVAEGIETAAQAEQLGRMGCDRGQGFYFRRPATAATVSGLLRSAAMGELLSS